MQRHSIGPTVPALLFAAVAMVSACSGPLESPLSPTPAPGTGGSAITAETLTGSWTLTTLQPSGGAVQPTPSNATYTLAFAGDRVSIQADCNRCSGALDVSGDVVTIGPALACTRAACPTMAFESIYDSILAGGSTAHLDGRTLVLTSARGRLTFVR
jgi:heat shock protein HslJ